MSTSYDTHTPAAFRALREYKESQFADSEDNIKEFRDEMLKMYPCPSIQHEQVSVSELFDICQNISRLMSKAELAPKVARALMCVAYKALCYQDTSEAKKFVFEGLPKINCIDDREASKVNIADFTTPPVAPGDAAKINEANVIESTFGTTGGASIPGLITEVDNEATPSQKIAALGLWAFFHLRAIVKGELSMKGYMGDEGKRNSKVVDMYVGFYQRSCPYHFAAANEAFYRELHNFMRVPTGEVRTLLFKSVQASSAIGEGSKSCREVLRGGALQTLLKHGFTAYSWSRRAADALGMSYSTYLSNIYVENITGKSISNIHRFVCQYLIQDDRHIPAVYSGLYKTSKSEFYPIARLLDSNYISYVGRKPNQALVHASMVICNTVENLELFTKNGFQSIGGLPAIQGTQIAHRMLGHSRPLGYCSELMKGLDTSMKAVNQEVNNTNRSVDMSGEF